MYFVQLRIAVIRDCEGRGGVDIPYEGGACFVMGAEGGGGALVWGWELLGVEENGEAPEGYFQ
jgi:hypothetical protein